MSVRPIHLLAPEMLVIITDFDRVKKVKEVLNDSLLRFMYVIAATGTAKSELLDVLGVGSVEKALITCLLPAFRSQETMQKLAGGLDVVNPGKGIVFKIPLSGVSAPVSRLFDEEHIKKMIDSLAPVKRDMLLEKMKNASENPEIMRKKRQFLERIESGMESQMERSGESSHELILSVVNIGYSDDLMDAAREAGARGGTVIHARRTGPEETVKFFGISLQAEKEVVVILIEKEKRNDIMKAISQACGLTTEAAGIVFSVPVDGVEGLSV